LSAVGALKQVEKQPGPQMQRSALQTSMLDVEALWITFDRRILLRRTDLVRAELPTNHVAPVRTSVTLGTDYLAYYKQEDSNIVLTATLFSNSFPT